MKPDRRAFLESSLALGALSLAATGCAAEEKSIEPDKKPGGSGFTLQMRFTGLFMFEVFPHKREMVVSFIDEKAVMVEEPHMALMMVDLADGCLKWPDEYPIRKNTADDQGLPLHAPQVLRVGNSNYGMWGLPERVIWVRSAHEEFYGPDAAPAFTFPSNVGKWKGLDQFLNMKEVVPATASMAPAAVPTFLPERVKTRIRLTRGAAVGEVPVTRCEREREYRLKPKAGESAGEYKSYATEFTVSYPVIGSEVVIGVAARGRNLTANGTDEVDQKYAVVTLRGKPGSTVALSFANCPTTRFHNNEHFSALSRTVGFDTNVREIDIRQPDACTVRTSPYAIPLAMRAAREKASGSHGHLFAGIDPIPPDPGCVPSFALREEGQ